ncbi:pseudaminic acid cytidylyltransferase [Oribacterium sp. C9]|uniref:pseudaminic acid cytidylyltransferase n=1 Tax=Oribacterium sp. C9 TaxID=1943579 RepID=UPI00098FF4D9|nr:pseudaminic acid cytidylyltransferase [Oribacterium sp. C9]OON86194.1 pseudaminic acid cytidylyltransferase [Oribacterium sp. C9]
MEKRNSICIIPARGGSKRIPRKNIIDFLGKPLLAYSIEAVKDLGIAETIIVSTDDKEIAEIAQRYGADVPFFRKKELADDDTGIADVLIDVIERYKNIGIEFNYTICVLASAPLLQKDKLIEAFKLLNARDDLESVCPVEPFSYPPQRSLVVRDGKIEMLHPENYFKRSQDFEKLYHDCGQFFMFRTEALLRDKKLYTQNMAPIYLDEVESQDIDNYTDLELAKIKYKLLFEKDGKK